MAKIPALMSYFGGKNRFESFIKPAAPRNYKIYLEPFAGSFAVYFFLDTPNEAKIIYNDINQDQTNLVACSKDYEKFYNFLKNEIENPNGSLYCKETDERLIKEHYKNLYYSLKNSNFRYEKFNIPDMNRASLYAFLLTSAFSSCSYTAAGFSGFKLKTFLNKLKNEGLQNKLSKINSFETLDFEQIIKKYDSPDTFIYLDPPYNTVEKKNKNADTRSGWYGTKDEFGQPEHTKLLELLKTLKSKWMLSYYYFDELENQLPKDKYVWLEKEFFRSSASFSESKNIKGNELLILNYDPNLNQVTEKETKEEIKEEHIEEKKEDIDDFWLS
jgi:DNA adenine methylase